MSIEEREDNQLGELTDDLFKERGGFPAIEKAPAYASGRQLPPNVDYQYQADNIQPGTITSAQWGANPIYDVLPANASRFNQSGIARNFMGTPSNEIISLDPAPQGEVRILRKIRYVVGPNGTGYATVGAVPEDLETTVTLIINGTVKNGLQNFLLDDSGEIPVYEMINSGDIVQLAVRFNYPPTSYNSGNDIKCYAHFSGDTLLENEIPFPYTALKRVKK